ncbi:MAG: hypothetical protein ACOZNI_30420 [Myxococcota bacterium]
MLGLLLGFGVLACAGQPDYVLVTVSGHCLDCVFEDYNPEYLAAEGAADSVAAVLEEDGSSVETWSYGDDYETPQDTGNRVPVTGFVDLVDDLETLRDDWVDGQDDATRVVVLCHSHGCVWAHTALHVVDDLPVRVLIDLDAVSDGWEDDDATFGAGDEWASIIDADGRQWPFDIADAADAWDIPGQNVYLDVEDVIPDSVRVNLEVWSDGSLVWDEEPNVRLDGSSDDVLLLRADEGHSEVDDVGSDALDWVSGELASAL